MKAKEVSSNSYPLHIRTTRKHSALREHFAPQRCRRGGPGWAVPAEGSCSRQSPAVEPCHEDQCREATQKASSISDVCRSLTRELKLSNPLRQHCSSLWKGRKKSRRRGYKGTNFLRRERGLIEKQFNENRSGEYWVFIVQKLEKRWRLQVNDNDKRKKKTTPTYSATELGDIRGVALQNDKIYQDCDWHKRGGRMLPTELVQIHIAMIEFLSTRILNLICK